MTPKKKSSKKRTIIIVVVFIIIIVVGVYLGLAAPFPIFSTSINISAIIAFESHTVNIGFPNTQMQVEIELTSASAFWGWQVYDSGGNPVTNFGDSGITTTPGTFTSSWFDLPPGLYNVTIGCIGTLSGTLTVYARGPPFVTP